MPSRITKTEKQLDDIIDFVADLLARRLQKRHIKRGTVEFVTKQMQLEEPTARTIENWISRAREVLIERSKKSRQQHHNEAVAFYESIITSPSTTVRERLSAQERIDKLFGLEAPTRTENTTELRAKVTSVKQMSDEELDALLGDEAAAGLPDGQPGAEAPPGGEDIPAELHDVHEAGLSDGLAPPPDL